MVQKNSIRFQKLEEIAKELLDDPVYSNLFEGSMGGTGARRSENLLYAKIQERFNHLTKAEMVRVHHLTQLFKAKQFAHSELEIAFELTEKICKKYGIDDKLAKSQILLEVWKISRL